MIVLVIDLLIVWRLTHLIQAEDGPWDVIFRAKKRLRPGGFWFELTRCFYCLSLWFGLMVSLIRAVPNHQWLAIVPYGIALSGGAVLAQLISGDK